MPKGYTRFLIQAAAIAHVPFLRRHRVQAALGSLQRMRISALERDQMHAICAATLRAGNPTLLRGALAWMDGQKDDLDMHVRTYGHAVHPTGMIAPQWNGAPCPEAALLWMRASWQATACPAQALDAALLRPHGKHGRRSLTMYRSFLAIHGWSDAQAYPYAPPYVGLVLSLIDRPHLPGTLRAEILDALARRPDADTIFADAHAHNPSYVAKALLRAYATTPVLIQCLRTRRRDPNLISLHKVLAQISAMPTPQEVGAMLSTQNGLQTAARTMRRATQKKPRNPRKLHAPATVRAKRAERAAKKAAAAPQG